MRRFHSRKALVAFMGIGALPYQSGQINMRSRSISKHGSAALRRTLFSGMSIYLQHAIPNEPVYQFMEKSGLMGNLTVSIMMASANRFLCIYYASIMVYLNA